MHTLIAAGVLNDQQRILLADFENRAADTTLGPTLTEAFRVDLAQSRAVQLEPPTAVADALTRMQRPVHTPLTPALAREVAQRDGLKAVVTGEIDPVGAGYVLSASVVGAADGRVLTAVRETADNAGALIPALDRLSRALRTEIGESLKTIRADEPLADVTTASMDALRKYTAAVRLANAGDDEGAVPLLQAATQSDTAFAMAYRKLAAVLANTAGSSDAALAAATQAFAHRDRLPELERDQAEAFYFGNVVFDTPKEIAAYQAVLALRPDNDIGLVDLGLAYERDGQFGAAESLYVRVIALQPASPNGYVDLADAEGNEGRYAAAESTLARLQRAAPGAMQSSFIPTLLVAAERRFPAADSLGRAALQRLAPRSGGRELTAAILANTSITQGRLAEGTQRAHEAMAIAEDRGLPGQYLQGAIELGELEARYRDRPAAALATISTALARHPLASIPPGDRPYADLARLYVLAGHPDEARRTLEEYDRAVPEGARRGNNQREAALGDVAVAEGHLPDAIAHYRAYHTIDGACVSCGMFELADAYRRSGAADSATVYYTRAIDAPGLFRPFVDSRTLAASYQRLGELQEKAGNRTAARDAYAHLLDLWASADPELQPIVRDARARVARLAADK
jgi:tetratricopeptide (TPR) repeat protein